MLASLISAGLLAVSAAGPDVVAVQAGTVHVVEGGQVLTDGATILIQDGKIVAVGDDVTIPAGARVVDYGESAVIVPGLVAANSGYGSSIASARTADPSIRAIDNFDFFSSSNVYTMSGGVTTTYVPPARRRLIAGQGAVVKLAGTDRAARTLSESAGIHGSIGADARSAPGYWKPPVPATVDVGMGIALQQLPRTTMGAIVALGELLTLARGGDGADLYGETAGPALAALMADQVRWRLGADTEAEIRALLRFVETENLSLVIEGGRAAADHADQLKAAGAAVVLKIDVRPEGSGYDRGKGRTTAWPVWDTAAHLAGAEVPFAIALPEYVSPRHILFAAGVASRGGLPAEKALAAITLDAARILGVADRVGSLSPGKDADLCVLSGGPLEPTSSVVATWVDGVERWTAAESTTATVIEVEELHLGDGHVLRPGQVLIQDGKIAEVGSTVAHPNGARVVRGQSAMPGMIDALGHLGLNGSKKGQGPDYKMRRIVGPGDATDARVARAGVTTVLLTPRSQNASGTPMMAYKPAAQDLDTMVVADPAAVSLTWSDPNRLKSGRKMKELLKKAVEYDAKWREYHEAMKSWTPPAPEPEDDEESDEDEDEDDEKKKNGDNGNGNGKDDDDNKKSKRRSKDKDDDDDEDDGGDPVSGVWTAEVDDGSFRMQLVLDDASVSGNLRCAALSDGLVRMEGTFADDALTLSGIGSAGWIDLTGTPKKGELEATIQAGSKEWTVEAERTAAEVRRADRPERRKPKEEKKKEPKGKPKMPGVDEKLEPIRRALKGEGALVVRVEREDEILACVAACEAVGIRPILYGASDAWRVADEIQSRVAGILLGHDVLARTGDGYRSEVNRYAVLDSAGIPLAFHSLAEEGASDLPLMAAFAVSEGLSPQGALRALTSGAADMMSIGDRVGRLTPGHDADVLLLDGPPLYPSTSVLRAWVGGQEVR